MSTPFTNTDAKIDKLIADSEQMDLEAEACHLGFSTSDLFGRLLLICVAVNILLTLSLLVLGVMNFINLQSGNSTI